MSPVLLFSIITVILGGLAALNYFYFYNVPFTAIFSILTFIFIGVTAFASFHDDD
jgi:hypothetical protein